MAYCLGIESTAHTFGVAVLDFKGKILSNVRKSFSSKHAGMIPREVAKEHEKNAPIAFQEALEKAGIAEKNISLISLSQGPGIGTCLQVGLDFCLQLQNKLNIPLVGANHCIAHLEIGRLLCKCRDPVMLYASGANTQVIAFESGKYRVFGETLDIGIGNMLDKFAREIGLGFPGGPILEGLYPKGKYVPLTYSVKGMDACFSGLLTQALRMLEQKAGKEDVIYSLQETAFSMLVEIAERAMAHCGKKELLLAGGVASSSVLQEKCRIMCKERSAKFFVPEREFLVDNAAMIAWLGILQYTVNSRQSAACRRLAAQDSRLETVDSILPHWRTDDVEVGWR